MPGPRAGAPDDPRRDGDPRDAVAGLLLAAGAGVRFGGPKALARADDGTPWTQQRVDALRAGGCERVLVVLGARAEQARALLPPRTHVVVAQRWREGLSASLGAGLDAAAALDDPPVAVLVALVDTPGLNAAAVARLVALAGSGGPGGSGGEVLARAVYRGAPGHPVLIGRRHWEGVARTATGDAGASAYLRAHDAVRVECADVADGGDVDRAGA